MHHAAGLCRRPAPTSANEILFPPAAQKKLWKGYNFAPRLLQTQQRSTHRMSRTNWHCFVIRARAFTVVSVCSSHINSVFSPRNVDANSYTQEMPRQQIRWRRCVAHGKTRTQQQWQRRWRRWSSDVTATAQRGGLGDIK